LPDLAFAEILTASTCAIAATSEAMRRRLKVRPPKIVLSTQLVTLGTFSRAVSIVWAEDRIVSVMWVS
jgi:hypothetical protein